MTIFASHKRFARSRVKETGRVRGGLRSFRMWLFVLALFVTRGLLRSERIVNWLGWVLDVEKSPFRSIGAVAAALAFIATVAILLVSAEVSRISGAA
jgi:hypothetical protein